jgi:Fe-S-cluster containining protein
MNRKEIENDDKLNKKLCGKCTSCCEYVNIEIATPKTKDDFDEILWYLLHKNVYVWIGKKNKWHVVFLTKCKPLKKGRCERYQTRPMLCREYCQEKCEKANPTRDEVFAFHTQKELISYLRKKKKPFFQFYE